MTRDQENRIATLGRQCDHAARTPGSRQVKKRSSITEAHVQQAVVEFLQLDGWRAFRTELTVQRERGRVVGERGQPDYLFIRYRGFVGGSKFSSLASPPSQTCADVVWIEFKRPGETPGKHQLAWHEAERSSGLNKRIAA